MEGTEFHFDMRNTSMPILALLLTACLTSQAAEPWTLERSLEYALEHNPDARIAQQRIEAAQAGLEQAKAAFWPKLQIQSSYTRSDNPMLVFGSILNHQAYSSSLNFNDVPETDNLNTRGLISVPLYAGGQNVAGRQTAEAYTQAAQWDEAGIRNTLSFEVARAFHTVIKTRAFICAAEGAVHSFETDLSIANQQLQNGTLLKSDALDIEVRLAQAREDLVRARNAHSLATSSLRNLLGIETGEFIVADTAPELNEPDAVNPSLRPELAAARARESAAQSNIRVAKSGYQPRVSLFASLDYDTGWETRGEGKSYTAGVMAQWDIWDGFLTRAKVRESQANLESAREEQRKLRLALNFEVEQARLNLETANARLSVTKKTIEMAAESADLVRKRFEQGAALASQLLDSETALLAARVRRAEAEADLQIANAALRKALALPQLETQPSVQ
jgi:outer membrane protein TolC